MTAAGDMIKASSRMGTMMGIATMIMGFLAIAVPMFTGVAITVVIAVLLLAAGIAMTVYAFSAETFGRGLFQFLFGGITALAGVAIFARPLIGLASITVVLTVYFFVDGIMAVVAGFQAKPMKGWGWVVFSGVAAIVLGVLIWKQWPGSAQWVVGLLVGIRLITAGWSMMMLGGMTEAAVDSVS